MAKKRKSSSETATKRVPPSIPKCVKRCPDGYCTEYINNYMFRFKKNNNGYSVFRTDLHGQTINMATNATLAPTTKALFSNLATLSKAIIAVETWLDAKLPDIR